MFSKYIVIQNANTKKNEFIILSTRILTNYLYFLSSFTFQNFFFYVIIIVEFILVCFINYYTYTILFINKLQVIL